MELSTQIQNLDEAVCVSIRTNNFGKGMNPTVFQQYIVLIIVFYIWELSEMEFVEKSKNLYFGGFKTISLIVMCTFINPFIKAGCDIRSNLSEI